MGIVAAITAIFKFLGEFLGFIESEKNKHDVAVENKEAQEQRNEIEEKPVDWLNEHFSNGMPESTSTNTATSSSSDKAKH